MGIKSIKIDGKLRSLSYAILPDLLEQMETVDELDFIELENGDNLIVPIETDTISSYRLNHHDVDDYLIYGIGYIVGPFENGLFKSVQYTIQDINRFNLIVWS